MKDFESVIGIKPINSALIIRSAPVNFCEKIIQDLHNIHPHCQLIIFCQPELAELYCNDARLQKVIINNKAGFFKINKLNMKTFKELWKLKPELAFIPYNNPFGNNYFHVHWLAFLSRAQKVLAIDPSWRAIPLKPLFIFGKGVVAFAEFIQILSYTIAFFFTKAIPVFLRKAYKRLKISC